MTGLCANRQTPSPATLSVRHDPCHGHGHHDHKSPSTWRTSRQHFCSTLAWTLSYVVCPCSKNSPAHCVSLTGLLPVLTPGGFFSEDTCFVQTDTL